MANYEKSKNEIRICNRCGKPFRILWTRNGNKAVQAVGKYWAPDPTAYRTYVTPAGDRRRGVECSPETPRAEFGYEMHSGKNCINPKFMEVTEE